MLLLPDASDSEDDADWNWTVLIYMIMKTSFLTISALHKQKDSLPNSWQTCLDPWTHFKMPW